MILTERWYSLRTPLCACLRDGKGKVCYVALDFDTGLTAECFDKEKTCTLPHVNIITVDAELEMHDAVHVRDVPRPHHERGNLRCWSMFASERATGIVVVTGDGLSHTVLCVHCGAPPRRIKAPLIQKRSCTTGRQSICAMWATQLTESLSTVAPCCRTGTLDRTSL